MLNVIPAAAMAPTMLSNGLNNKELRNKILIFIACLLVINALGIGICIQFPQLTGVFEMTSITFTLMTAACIFILPKFFSKAKPSENINHEGELLSNLTICNFERRVIAEYNINQINDSLSEDHVSYITRNLFYRSLMILATGSENSYISPTVAPLLAHIIGAIDSAVCTSIDVTTATTKAVTKSVMESSTTRAICSSINTAAIATYDIAVSSSGYVSSTLSSVSLRFVSFTQSASNLVGNLANSFGIMRLNIHS
ncbi:MAG: hypothetical protein U0X86_000518 [Wolbachia endosymbiont of Xenopsylla cheopis]